uniref:Class I lanthipeptide n=1 Tax=Roseihalotalea indica TaxID=2867963 RepID=A0AA49GI07_9BACT|nr:class I lanthipeptide [Tunicatimonas sp. TK19036]
MKEHQEKPEDQKDDQTPEQLNKETLSNLDDEELKKVAGGRQIRDADAGSCILGSC